MFQVIVYSFLSPLLWLFISLFALFTKKGRERIFSERAIRRSALRKLAIGRADKDVLCFHAASAGEFEQLKPLLSLIDRSKFFIFQTFTSPTIYRKEKKSDLFDAVCYHPVDSIISALIFFGKISPRVYVPNRHDIWPSHLLAAKIRGIKSVLINANMYEKSGRYKYGVRSLNRWMFESFSLVLCGSERIKKGLLKLAPDAKVDICGESRFDQVLKRRDQNKKNHFSWNVDKKKNIVLGSIIPSDYDVIFLGIRKLLENKSCDSFGYRILAVPHEVAPKNISHLIEKLEEYGFTYCLYSNNYGDENSDVVIVDVIGILPELYVYADSAYIGAGFGAGVHNVIEPAVYGKPTFYGPNFHILDEAVSMIEDNVSVVVNNSDDVYKFLKNLENRVIWKEISKKTENFVISRTASAEDIVNKIIWLTK